MHRIGTNRAGKSPAAGCRKGTTAQAACLDEQDGYKLRRKHPMFVIELTNKCETRMICKVYAFVISAHGTAQGHGTIRLAAAAPGQPSKGTFTMKAKAMRGSSHSDRECRAL